MTRASAYSVALKACEVHAARMHWAITQLEEHIPLAPADMAGLTPMELAIFDQFSTRFSKLQDAMGTRLLPGILELTQEQGELNAFIDKLNRLEKIGAIESADEWLQLREMRNQFAHDYPEDPEIQASLLNKAFAQGKRMLEILEAARRFAVRYTATIS